MDSPNRSPIFTVAENLYIFCTKYTKNPANAPTLGMCENHPNECTKQAFVTAVASRLPTIVRIVLLFLGSSFAVVF